MSFDHKKQKSQTAMILNIGPCMGQTVIDCVVLSETCRTKQIVGDINGNRITSLV